MTQDSIFGNLISGAAGGLIVLLVGHFLTKERETIKGRQERKTAFLGFIGQFHGEVAHRTIPYSEFAKFYTDKLPNLRDATNRIEGDFSPRQRERFKKLVAAAILTSGEADKGDRIEGRKEITAALEAIENFVKNPTA